MAITRANVATYLDEQFSELATSVGQSADPTVGYKPDIDAALRKLGKTESELATTTVEDSQREAIFALASFYAARRLWRALGGRVEHTMGETSMKFADQRKQAKEIMDSAAADCADLGYYVVERVRATFKVY